MINNSEELEAWLRKQPREAAFAFAVRAGYQVIKKWLSYRQHYLLGRPLTVEESRHVTNMARRLTVIVLLSEELNANYRACRDAQ
jgi:hypothetical protein